MPRGSAAPHLRLQAIETLLLWEGQVSRARLLELFDVHPTLASRDIATFRARFPSACHPEGGGRRFVADDGLSPVLTVGEFFEYQLLIGVSGDHSVQFPGVALERVLPDRTQVSHRVFACLHRAVRAGMAVEIRYRSMANPTPHSRLIRPHAFIQAGPRWHVRAYSHDVRGFRDFNLGRITAAEARDQLELPGADQDDAWNTRVRLRFVPHQDLPSAQAALVRDEYMDGTAALAFEVRQPLTRYFVQALNAAVDPSRERPPRHLLMVKMPHAFPSGTLFDQ